MPRRPAACRSVLAHGIWLDDEDRAVLRGGGAQIAHCPSSNLFLGSGLFDWRGLERRRRGGILATDVGGGTSLSMLRTMADAYKVQALAGVRLDGLEGAACRDARRGRGAGAGDEIGSLDAGCIADVRLGLGGRPGGAAPIEWRAPCMSASSRG